MIKLNHVFKKYNEIIINDFSYTFKDKGFYLILGNSGSGKSTLLNLISGIDIDYSGRINVEGREVKTLNNKQRKKFRLKNIGYVFQDFKLVNILDVESNILINFESINKVSNRKKQRMIESSLKNVDLINKKATIVNKLSGGEKQRVAIARAIINEPKILLCDEPTGNLDSKNSIEIFKTLKEYSKNHLVIVVSHDEENSYKYADNIIKLIDGKITSIEIKNKIDDKQERRIVLPRKSKNRIPFPLLLKIGFNKIKEKKIRSSFVNFITSISLLSIGIGILISSSLNEKIVEAFSSVVAKNQMIVTKKNSDPNLYTSFSSSSYENVLNIYKEYNDYLLGVGANYLNNFNDFFFSRNELIVHTNDDKISLPNFHAAIFEDFYWIEERKEVQLYPNVERDLKLDEVILGIDYEDLVNICLSLKIERSFESLGSYLQDHELMIELITNNDDWLYYKESYFTCVSVYPSINAEVTHTNHYFNEFFFEKELSLPTTFDIENESEVPWMLKKVYNIHSFENPTYIIESISNNHIYDGFILEKKETFLKQECESLDLCDRNIVYIFNIDKNTINISDIKDIKNESEYIDNYYFTSTQGLMMHSSGMLEGFNNDICFSFDEEKAVEVGDYFSRCEGEIEKFDGTAIGGLKINNNESVKFSSNLSKLKDGELPKDYYEIVVSTGLLNYLNFKKNPLYEELYYSYYSPLLDSVILNKFKIVGIVENDKNCIYHNPMFSISFFKDMLGVSAFSLLPNSIVLNFKDDVNIEKEKNKLEKKFKNLEFNAPLLEIGNTVNDVMKYVSTISNLFSIVSVSISILLLMLISYLNTIESKKEIELLNTFGHNKFSIISYVLSNTFSLSFITTIMSVFEMSVFEIIFSKSINAMFGLTSFSFSFKPILLIIILGIFLPIIISFLISYLYLLFKKD